MHSTAEQAQGGHLRRELGIVDLVLFNVAALVSMRWIGVAAHVGPGSLVLWIAAAFLFLIPCAFAVAGLSHRFPQEGGLYIWTREAFGPWHAFVCGWFYYLNNLFWIPGLLVSSVGMMSVAFSHRLDRLSEEAMFVLPCSLLLLVLAFGTNYAGLAIAKWMDNCGGAGAYFIAGALAITAIGVWFQHGAATRFDLLPKLDPGKLNFWSQMAMAMTGLELSPILSGEIRNPRRMIRRATWISAAVVVVIYLCSTSAMLVVLKPEEVSPVTGLAQAGRRAGDLLGQAWIPLAIGAGILFSVGGQLGTYVGACARLPFVLGLDRYLPPEFARLHPKFGTPTASLVLLGLGSAVLLLLSQLGETFRSAYQFTVDLTVISLFVPFLYIFCAAWKFGQRIPAICGLSVSILAIVFSFLPTEDVRSVWWFEGKLIGGCVLLLVLARWCYTRYRPSPVRELKAV